MVFKNGVKNIQAAVYNGACRVHRIFSTIKNQSFSCSSNKKVYQIMAPETNVENTIFDGEFIPKLSFGVHQIWQIHHTYKRQGLHLETGFSFRNREITLSYIHIMPKNYVSVPTEGLKIREPVVISVRSWVLISKLFGPKSIFNANFWEYQFQRLFFSKTSYF